MDDFNALHIHMYNIIVDVKSDYEIFSKNEKKIVYNVPSVL